MKRYLYTTLFALLTFLSVGAQTANTNHVKSTTYQIPVLVNDLNSVSDNDKIESTTYFDGLGRTLQSVMVRGGGNEDDIVTHMEYDALGRQSKSYLPYPEVNNNGDLVTNPMAQLTPYYLSEFPDDAENGVINAYSETHYENSQLNRVLEIGAPGMSWKVDTLSDNDHTIKYRYLADGPTVYNFEVLFGSGGTSDPSLSFNGFYPTNTLN